MAKKAETTFKERVRRDLETLPATWFVKIQQVVLRGIPDFLISIGGRFIAIELKKSRKAKREPLQEWTLEKIADTGAYSFIAYPENWPEIFSKLKDLAESLEIDDSGERSNH